MMHNARFRIAITGALVTLVLLAIAAIAARIAIHSILLADLDEELETLSVAIGSDLELRGAAEVPHEALRAGMESNTFVYRLEHHAAVLFDDRGVIAATGDLARHGRLPDLRALARHDERPFTAREPFTGQHRICRIRVSHLGGRAAGTNLLIFRSIETISRTLRIVDAALALLVAAGSLITALVLAIAVRPLLTRLQRSFDAQRQLVSDVAHELKTPAAVIAAEAQELARGHLSEREAREAQETIARAASGLAREVDDLLELARIDAAAMQPAAAVELEIDEAVDDAIAAAAALAKDHGISIVREGRADSRIRGDRAGITRAVANLILNAVRYSPRGSRVRVATRQTEKACDIDVADRGPGVPAAERARIFERFVRLPNARKRHPEGSGLGLAIVDQVVRAHGGSVDVLDAEEGGALFRIRLPVTRISSSS
ncbi:MAG TPA: HAMP domain-containing sensor histidine kinase [Thermoanaerobaculia bacterium]|nr:HAMP domain-containing sensor histidine kinase [Thermoanaerobaculia bacterium]